MRTLGAAVRLRRAHVLCALACIGCSSDDASDAGAGGSPDAGNAQGAALLGNFIVNFVPALGTTPAFASVVGKLYDGPQPPPLPFELDSEADGCQLLVPTHPLCDPACRGGACTADGVCTPFPQSQDVGTVRVTGLGDDLALEPIGTAFTYQTRNSLPLPPCDEGADVRVEADAFDIQAKCIAPLELIDDDAIPVRAGEPISLTWTPGGQDVDALISIVLDISHHGGQKGEIDCEVPDTGSFEIPEALVTDLVNLGVAGFPTIVIARLSIGTAAAHPDVHLTLSSPITRDVDLGVPSCMTQMDCPAGTTCNEGVALCE